jgi:hypothetical protein
MPPIHFPSDARAFIYELSEAVPPAQRDRFFQRVLGLLSDDEIHSPARIAAVCQKVQIEFRIAPAVADPAVVRPTRSQPAR